MDLFGFLDWVDNWMKELVIFFLFIWNRLFLLILELHFEIFEIATSYFMLKENYTFHFCLFMDM